MTRLGYQIPNFTYPGRRPGRALRRGRRARPSRPSGSGFDTVMLMDHFYQLPMLGAARRTTCSSATRRSARWPARRRPVRLGALVTGNTYRNPTLLAKTITALDIVSGGRAQLGIGAGWFELEHDSLGFEFGTFTDRFEKLEEALQIILPMLRDERPTLAGKHYTVNDAINQPPPVGRIPIMIGGSGEKKTLRMVAQYADESNLTSAVDEMPRKLDALAAHCERLGRDRSEITVSQALNVCIAETHDEAYADMRTFLADRGHRPRRHGRRRPRAQIIVTMVVWGDPDEVGERLTDVLEPRRRRLHLLAARPTATSPAASSCSARWVRPPSKAEEPLDPLVVGTEVSSEDPDHVVDVEGSGRDHVLQVGPVAGPVEEGLEDRQVEAGQERDADAAEVLLTGSRRGLLVEVGGVEEQVDRGGVPEQADLAVALDRRPVPIDEGNVGWQRVEHLRCAWPCRRRR